MNLENVKLAQLRALVAVAECGNFGEAGLQLSISQSAVSHAIASLEQELGVVLMTRGRRGATLTPVGERILIRAKEMLRLLEEIGKEANLAKGLQGGEVRVASFRSVATHILPRVIAQFRERFPAIAVTLNELHGCVPVEQELKGGRADIGITLLPSLEEFSAWELLRDEYLVLFPPTYPLENSPLTWEQLIAYPLIMTSENDECRVMIHQHLSQYLSQLGQSLKPAYEVREDSTVVSMVRQGLGVGIMPRLAAEPIPPGIQIRSLPVPLERIIGVVILKEALHSPAVYAFLDILTEMSQSGQLIAA